VPATTIIDRDQRQGLYALVRNHLTSIEDFWLALHREEDEVARGHQLAYETCGELLVELAAGSDR